MANFSLDNQLVESVVKRTRACGVYSSTLLITDISEYPSLMEVEDWYLPVAQAGITECSTYAVVCRLKSSPSYTITSYGGSFNHPCYPGVTVTIPKNAVARKTRVSLELKVGVVNDLIYNTRHLCTRFGIAGTEAMSRCISGGKQVIKFANTSNRGRVFFFPSKR